MGRIMHSDISIEWLGREHVSALREGNQARVVVCITDRLKSHWVFPFRIAYTTYIGALFTAETHALVATRQGLNARFRAGFNIAVLTTEARAGTMQTLVSTGLHTGSA
jgi:hypothetical protein